MAFLAPAFLLGLAALAIPILIHLIHRERSDTLLFPSLMFLRKIPYRSVRRQKIRHWLLFLMRCLALILLALAFGRPFLERPGRAAISVGGARELVILIDRSYSMGYADRWERALAAARRAIDGVSPGDRASLVFFSDRAEAANQPTADRARLRALLDSARLGYGITRYEPALKLAGKILEESKLPHREVVLITDFQKVGWDGQAEVRLPPGTALSGVDLSERQTANVAVTSVVLEREYLSGRERIAASARLTNKAAVPVRDLQVSLELNDRAVEVKRVSFDPNSSTTVAFDPFTLPEGITRGTVRAAPDALPRDNAFHFVVAPGQALSVLILESAGSRANQSLYLRRALGLGDRPAFKVEVKKLGEFSPADLSGRSLVILNDAAFPRDEAGRRLRSFLEKGGGLLVVLGEAAAPAGWQGPAGDLLPGPFGSPVDRSGDWGGALAYLDYAHPAFELFSAPRSGDFSSARFFRYRPLQVDVRKEGPGRPGGPSPRPASAGEDPAEGRSPEAPGERARLGEGQAVLARFDDGSIALAEKKVGKGKVLVWTSTLDTFWNNFALQPIFLPFVHQLIKYASGYAEARHWYTVGQVLDLSRYPEVVMGEAPEAGAETAPSASAELVSEAPSGEKSYLRLASDPPFLSLEEQGFYELRHLGASLSRPTSLAVNLDLAESDLSSLDPEELAGAVAPAGAAGEGASLAEELTPEEKEQRQALWWYILGCAFLILALETILSNRLSRVAR